MKKRIALVLACVMALSAFLVACGNAAGNGDATTDNNTNTEAPAVDDTDDADDSADAEPVSFRFSWWGDQPRHDATQDIIDMYVEENPHVTITPEFAPWSGYQDQFAISLQGGQEADLMQINYNWIDLYSPDGTTFLDLDTVSQYLDLDNWDSEILDMMRPDGVLQAVPTGIVARVPFINKTVYDNAGITELPTTWDELKAAGQQIQSELGSDFYALSPLGNASGAYMVFQYLNQLTGKNFVDEDNVFQFDLDEMTTGFQFYWDLVEAGVVRGGEGNQDSDAINSQNPLWIEGHYGGVQEWDSSINNWLNNLSEGQEIVVTQPWTIGGGADLASGIIARPSMGFAISANTENPEEVAKFLEFMLTDPRAVERMGVDRGVPSNTAALEIFRTFDFDPLVIEANQISLSDDAVTMSPIFENPSVREIYEDVLARLQYGLLTPAQAAQEVIDNIQATIDSEVGR